MPRPIRDRDPRSYRLITIRTLEARLFLSPNGKTKRLIGGILARYQELCGVKIYAYFVLGNHIHLVVKAPNSNLDEFEENVNREISRRLNWKHRREGAMWGERYNDHKVLTERDLKQALLYVATNATKHGLVEDCTDWPGLHCYQHLINEEDREFSFYHYSAKAGEPEKTTHKLKLSVIPEFESLTKAERRKLMTELLAQRTAALVKERQEAGKGFLGVEAILRQSPWDTPKEVDNSPSPPCYTSDAEARKEFKEQCRATRVAYTEASFRFRLGDLNVEFPVHTYRPPLHRVPRSEPFKPMTPGCLVAA